MSALLEAASLSKTFFSEHNALPAVCNVSFSVAPGECLGLAGASGCGKSTLARLLMGLTPADSGTVSFNGQPLDFADATAKKLLQSGPAGFSKCRCGFSPPEKHRQLDHAANAELRLY